MNELSALLPTLSNCRLSIVKMVNKKGDGVLIWVIVMGVRVGIIVGMNTSE